VLSAGWIVAGLLPGTQREPDCDQERGLFCAFLVEMRWTWRLRQGECNGTTCYYARLRGCGCGPSVPVLTACLSFAHAATFAKIVRSGMGCSASLDHRIRPVLASAARHRAACSPAPMSSDILFISSVAEMSRASESNATLWLLAISRALAILKRITSVELLGTYVGQLMVLR
jgi:hypothetical protein